MSKYIKTCNTCGKEIKVGDKYYHDSYFGQYHCSWKHAVEYMSEFFGMDEEYFEVEEKED